MIIPRPTKIEFLEETDGFSVNTLNPEKAIVEETLDETLPCEGYTLKLLKEGAHISYKDNAGRAHALATLEQMLKSGIDSFAPIFIEDSPRIAMRKYMMDVGRYFFPVEEILKQIDYLSLYKFNYLHLHLTEDQGWRVEIKALPKLTEIGSIRRRTLMRLKKHQGFYTQEELKKIVDYAHSKGIKVIPEIDMPGHFQSALASYPELGCFGRKVKVAENFGIKFDVACLGKPTTLKYVKIIIDELSTIFTDGYFHIGGDEAPSQRWELCPDCKKKYAELGCKNYAEYQAHFMNEVGCYLLSKGITPIMWNESNPTGLIDKRIIWECWNIDFDNESFIKEIETGRKIIVSKSEPYYLDLPYGINSLKRVYDYEPNVFTENFIGASTSLWTELIPNVKVARKKAFPRLLAVAERLWAEEKDYNDFITRVRHHECSVLKSFNVKRTPCYKLNPNPIIKLFSKLWWTRRVLYWAGLYNVITNAILKKSIQKTKPKQNY